MKRIGFDCDKYVELQTKHIRERIDQFGGKLFDDFHAARVLPGFKPSIKIDMLSELKDVAEIVITINANDIEKNKVRGDLGITYDQEVLRLIDAFRACGLYVGSVVLAQYNSQPAAKAFQQRLEKLGVTTYKHYTIEGYPSNIKLIVSEQGYGKNEYIHTTRKLIVVTAPGPGSGKMATCLSQLYHEHEMGVKAGYAKFETFPIWNIPLKHPVNVAYEAATADLDDNNVIDPFHLEAYGVQTVNYNRDVEIYPVLNAIFERIYGYSPYKSPTDMGVNMVGQAIIDDDACREAGKQEIIRRYYEALCQQRKGMGRDETVYKIELLMNRLGLSIEDRAVAVAAVKKAQETGAPAAALQLHDGRIITGRTSSLLGASSAMLLNALKTLAGIDDSICLISPSVIEPIQDLKIKHLRNRNPRLHTDEVLIALSVCAVTDKNARNALDQLENLSCCEMHSSVLLSQVDEKLIHRLGINLTSEPVYQTKKLYHA